MLCTLVIQQIQLSSSTPGTGWEVSGSSPGHNKDFKNATHCYSACAGHNELEKGECLSHKKTQLIPYTMDLQTKVV